MSSIKQLSKGYDVKKCSRCGREKPTEEFSKNKGRKDGLSCYCRSCWSEYNAGRTEQRKKYYEGNREKILDKQRKYHRAHCKEITDKRREYHHNYNKEHHEERNAYNRMWRAKNKEKIKQRRYEEGVRYRAKYKDEIRERKQAYENRRRSVDPMFKLKGQVRVMLRDSFRRKGLKKSDNTEKILGCSLGVFQKHLLQTWRDRYGADWNGEECHIDHVVPLATARTEKDVVRLCHYTNLQLLTPADNFRKGGRA